MAKVKVTVIDKKWYPEEILYGSRCRTMSNV